MAQIQQVNIRISCPFCHAEEEYKVDVAIAGASVSDGVMAHHDGFTIEECKVCGFNFGVDLQCFATVRK